MRRRASWGSDDRRESPIDWNEAAYRLSWGVLALVFLFLLFRIAAGLR